MSRPEHKTPTVRALSVSSRSSITKPIISRHGSTASSSASVRSENGGALDWEQAQERARRLEPITLNLHQIENLKLRLIRPDEEAIAIHRKPEPLVKGRPQDGKYYISDKQPDIAQNMIIEFDVPSEKLTHCRISLTNCIAAGADYHGNCKAKHMFTNLLRIFTEEKKPSAIRLAPCVKLDDIVLDAGKVNKWATSAVLSIDKNWVDESKSFREAPLVGFYSYYKKPAECISSIRMLAGGQELSFYRPSFPDHLQSSSSKKWEQWLGPMQPLDGNPSVKAYVNVKVVEIKRNVFG